MSVVVLHFLLGIYSLKHEIKSLPHKEKHSHENKTFSWSQPLGKLAAQSNFYFFLFFLGGGHSKSLSNLSQHYSSGDVYKNMTLYFLHFFSSVLHVTSVLRVMTTHMVHVSHLKHSLCFWSSPWDLNSSVWCCRSLWAHASLSIQKVSHLLCRRL